MPEAMGEAHMEQPLLEWLERMGRIRPGTIVMRELFWFGRRIDLVTLTRSGRATAYELKLRHNKRAVQQASYNRLAFDRRRNVERCLYMKRCLYNDLLSTHRPLPGSQKPRIELAPNAKDS